MIIIWKHSCEITSYILPFLLSYSSFICGLVPLIGKLAASSLIEAESGATVLLVNEFKCENRGLDRKQL